MLGAIFRDPGTLDGALVRDIRLPRAASGVIAGGALGAAAVLLIAVTRNPLAESATLGLTAGGTLAVTLAAAYSTIAPGAPTIAVAFVGVLFGAALIGAIAAAAGASPVRIVLAGMAISLALAAVTAAIQLLKEAETSSLFLWGAGSLLQSGWEQVRPGALIGVVVLAGAVGLARALDVATLGESTAKALGQRTGLTRLLSVLAATLLTAVAVGVAGPIAFVGILSAALARAARPRGHAAQLLVAVPWGAAIVVFADVAGRLIFGVDNETPAGVICALLGAPILVVAARRLRDGGAPAIDAAASTARWRPGAVVARRRSSARVPRSRASASASCRPVPARSSGRSSARARDSATSSSSCARRGCAWRCSPAPASRRRASCCRRRSATRSRGPSSWASPAARRSRRSSSCSSCRPRRAARCRWRPSPAGSARWRSCSCSRDPGAARRSASRWSGSR